MYADIKGYWKRRKSMAMVDLESTAQQVYDADRVFSVVRVEGVTPVVMIRTPRITPQELADKVSLYNGDVIVHNYSQYL